MGGEGGNMVEGSMENLETLYERGVRYLGLTWNTSNAIGTSARDESERGRTGGLTDFGKEVIRKMDALGMMIDVSHLGETAFWDVINISKNPIIASHSAFIMLSTLRNLKMIDSGNSKIRRNNCINFYNKFLDPGLFKRNNSKIQRDIKEIEKNYGDDLEFNEEIRLFDRYPSESGTSIDF
jgi:membrane dipeptidase